MMKTIFYFLLIGAVLLCASIILIVYNSGVITFNTIKTLDEQNSNEMNFSEFDDCLNLSDGSKICRIGTINILAGETITNHVNYGVQK